MLTSVGVVGLPALLKVYCSLPSLSEFRGWRISGCRALKDTETSMLELEIRGEGLQPFFQSCLFSEFKQLITSITYMGGCRVVHLLCVVGGP